MKKFTWLFLFITSLLISCAAPTPEQSWEAYADQVTIMRDQWGIPHIYGKTDADAVFGMIYAQCEDDFNRVEVNYINALGRMAEVAGEDYIFTDFRMKLYINEDELKKEYANSAPWLKELMDAWAAGINYYLLKHPEVKPKLITQFEPYMALAFIEGSIGGDIETISTNGLKAFYEENFMAYTENPVQDWEEEPKGSNGFAIAPELTQNGHALLMINPHTSFYFRPEMHVVSEEGLNAYGAVTWGQFFIYQGFNENNGWMHTSAKADAIDHFALTVEKRDNGYFYKFGEEWRPLTEKVISIPYKSGDETLTKNITAYYSHHGPVIRKEGDKWIAISLMVEHEKALTQSYQRTKTTNHAEFKENMNLKTNSSNSTVYADKNGTIAYYHGNFVPVRDPQFDWRNVVDGSDPRTDWQGLHEVEEMIYIENPSNGWIQNCNSTPFTAAGPNSPDPANYPPYVAWDVENARGLNAVRILTDKKDLTLETLISEVAYEPTLMAFKPLIPALVAAYQRMPNGKRKDTLKGPIDTLANWDLKTGAASVGTSLAVFYGNQLLSASRSLEREWNTYIFDFLAANASDEMMLGSLEKAIERLNEDFGTWDIAWGEINRFQRLTGEIQATYDDEKPSIPVGYNSSMWGSLAAYGSRAYPNTKKWYGNVGNSFVAAVEFGDKVRAKSLLAGGQSGDPNSPHFTDQAEMYSRGEFKDVYYYKEDVTAHAKETYQPGKR
ncbi:penicillin acylase family protein [Penaeicola halotolerans]|uniref:penicillin acylase family protein n=1 Tax=Penaeicola halotolerans TaxID=2793196 RepID=UPI001CF89011|nr:penicillin acylase family protein [Penaeicola halotolerans]